MKQDRIFISSVMRDFGPERAAAREAILTLRQQPVMAEDFGAQPYSSQTACMEGVRGSDVYVGIFGQRYGSVGQSGLSATEEEFNEARRRGIPILCFEQKGAKEKQQANFLARLKAYDQGYAFAFFSTPDELKTKVVQALFDLISQPGIATLDSDGATAYLDKLQWGSRRIQFGTWLGVILLPARQGENYIDELELGKPEMQDRLLQPALFGATALFRQDLGVQKQEGPEHLTFLQETAGRAISVTLSVRTDGTLVYGTTLPKGEPRGRSLVRSSVIDEDEVHRATGSYLGYADLFYQQLERGAVIAKLYLGVSLTGLELKAFGHVPRPEPSGFTIPMHRMNDPLYIPRPPLAVARAQLSDAESLGKQVTELVARAFRVANAYYAP